MNSVDENRSSGESTTTGDLTPRLKLDNRAHVTLADVSIVKTRYDIYAESAIGGRSDNQDFYSAIETPYGLFLVVCDGMGGAQGGAIASRLAVSTIIESIENYSNFTTPSEMLRDVVAQANIAVYQRGIADPQLKGMGTTVVAMLLSDEKATVVHVGDSRLYQIRNGAKIFRTFDHSSVFQLVSQGRLTEEEARTSSGSNVILQAVGTRAVVDNIEINDDIPFVKGDRFLLCTDGVSGAVPEDEVLRLATKSGSVKESVNNMIRQIDALGVSQGGEHDNLTAIILDVKDSSKLKSSRSGVRVWLLILAIVAIVVILLAGWAVWSLLSV